MTSKDLQEHYRAELARMLGPEGGRHGANCWVVLSHRPPTGDAPPLDSTITLATSLGRSPVIPAPPALARSKEISVSVLSDTRLAQPSKRPNNRDTPYGGSRGYRSLHHLSTRFAEDPPFVPSACCASTEMQSRRILTIRLLILS